MPITISIREAILKALQFKKTGDDFSLIQVTEMVTSYREKLTTDGSVSRRLREFNAGKHDISSGLVFRCDAVKDGVYRITCMEPKSVTVVPDTGTSPDAGTTTYTPPAEQVRQEFKPVDRKEDGYLF